MKIKIVLFAAIISLSLFSASAMSETVGNSAWGYVNVYSGNGPGKAGMFNVNGYTLIRFYNSTGSYIYCKVRNDAGEWATTGSLAPGAFKDIGVGNVPGEWKCWFT